MTKKIKVEKVVKQMGKITVKIKIIRGLVVWYYYYSKISINIKLK